MQQLRNWQREYRAKIQQIDQQLSAEEPVSVSTFTDEIEASFGLARRCGESVWTSRSCLVQRIRQARALEDEQYLSLNEQLQLTLAHAEELKIQRDQLKTRRDNFAQQLNELAVSLTSRQTYNAPVQSLCLIRKRSVWPEPRRTIFSKGKRTLHRSALRRLKSLRLKHKSYKLSRLP
jgi:hypothetical protein